MAQELRVIASETMHQKIALKARLAELLGASSRIEDVQIETLADALDQIRLNALKLCRGHGGAFDVRWT